MPILNLHANIDDGSCGDSSHINFSFKGIFQECKPVFR